MPTLLAGSCVAAQATPPRARNSATSATHIEADGRLVRNENRLITNLPLELLISDPRSFELQGMTAHLGALDLLDDALGFIRRYLDECKPLEHPHVAHRLAVQSGGGSDRVDDVGRLQPGRPPARDDQLPAGALTVGRDVRLGVARRLGLDRSRRDVRVLHPRRELYAGVALDGLDIPALLGLVEGDRPAAAAHPAGAADAVDIDVRGGGTS